MSDSYLQSTALMGTMVTVHVVGHGADEEQRAGRRAAVERALTWFRRVEESCSRFEEGSEVRQLTSRAGERVPVSEMLFEPLRFALAVAEESGGAFDPTVGHAMEQRGFDREYRSGRAVRTTPGPERAVSHRDVLLDVERRTVTLRVPLVLDLGAVAKGLAVDLAARELKPFGNFAIDAGGDLSLGGCNAEGQPWSVGIRHPRAEHALIETLRVSDVAVCTSGDYERSSPKGNGGHHILDPRTGEPAAAAASVTVLAASAMVADALGTAAFVLGPARGVELLERHGVEGLIVTPSLDRFVTHGFSAVQGSPASPRSGPAVSLRTTA